MSGPAGVQAHSNTVAQWASFTIVAAVLTVSLLLLARQSQQLLEAESGPTQAGSSARDDAGDGDLGNQTDRFTGTRPLSPEAIPSDTEALTPRTDRKKSSESADFSPTDPRQDIELTPALLLANVALTQGGVIVLVLAAAWYFEIPATALGITGDPTSTGLPAVALGIGFGVVLWIGNELSTAVADAVGASYDESLRELLSPSGAGGWLTLFGLVLPIIALSEELLFRAALIGVPAAGFGISPWLLAVGASLAFALGHGAQGRVGIVVTGLLGFVLAAGYIRSGSLLVVVVAHYLINGLEFFVHEYLGVGAIFSQ